MENKQTDINLDSERAAHATRTQPVPMAKERLTHGGHLKTIGERKFDTLTYNHIGYVANALMSVAAVFWVERTHSGQNFMRSLVKGMSDLTKANPKTAEMLATKSFFLTGGFAVLLPMKWLENAKTDLVKRWNRQAYGDQVDSDPVLIQSMSEMEAAPKQTWSSIFSGRVLALIPFYITVGAMWDRTSLLARATNPALASMSKEARATMEVAEPKKFSQIAAKGLYFDRPIAGLSRVIGKGWASLTGNHEAAGQIKQMQNAYPGMIKHSKAGKGESDPVHSVLPYYFISEAITSGIVAWGVFHLTRMTGYVFGKKSDSPDISVPALASLPEVVDSIPSRVPVLVNTAGLAYHSRIEAPSTEHARA